MGEHANLHARSPSCKRVAAWGFAYSPSPFSLFVAGGALVAGFNIKEAGIVEISASVVILERGARATALPVVVWQSVVRRGHRGREWGYAGAGWWQ